jgi:hypothetical protein
MATSNQVNVGLSGSTGSGSFVGSTSPTLVTPVLGVATATSLTFNPTTGGIVGTTTNDNTTAGDVGELIESEILVGSAVALVTATNKDITSISLTAGDWDVWGNVIIAPAAGTTTTAIAAWVHTVSATGPTVPNKGAYDARQYSGFASATQGVSLGMRRYSLSGTTTIYLECVCNFAVSTCSAYGYIGARRRR